MLERLSGPLCDAVTGQDGGHAVLAALDRGNLFLVPLDRPPPVVPLPPPVRRRPAGAPARDEQPDAVAGLHRRASGWFERTGEPAEAIRHALAGEDVERAANLVELAIPATQQARREATLRGWLEALPDEVIRCRPVLSNGYAGSLLATGEVEGVEARLRDAEAGWTRRRMSLPELRSPEAR